MIRPRSCIAMLFRGHFDFYGAYAFIVSFLFFYILFPVHLRLLLY